MAQHDYVIANQSGASFRADLNNGLAAIVSNNSGASAPSTTFAFQWWADTTANVLKMRNAANDGWITIRELDGDYETIGLNNGTAAAPSLYFAEDADDNTGLFSGGADQLNITTGGTERAEFGATEVVFNDGGANYDFRVEGDTNTNLVVVDASADSIGIGTNAPGTLIEIDNAAPYVTVKNNTEEDTDGGRESRLIFEGEQSGGEISTLAQIEVSHDGTADDEKGKLVISTNDGSDGATPTTAVTIDSSQNVTLAGGLTVGSGNVSLPADLTVADNLLVGTSATRGVAGVTPQLLVEGLSANTSTIGIAANSNDTNGSFLALGKSRGTADGATTIVQNGDSLGEIRFGGADGTDLISEAARIGVAVDGTPGADDMPGRLVFSTTADGASSPTERMRILSGGNVLVNDTVQRDLTGQAFQVSGFAMFFQTATGVSASSFSHTGSGVQSVCIFRQGSPANTVGSISVSGGTSTIYSTSSDYRLKENFVTVTDGITRLKQLKPSRFNFIADPDRTVDGFIAHEVQDVVPEAITGEKDAVDEDGNPIYQGIDQSKLVPLLTAALQEAIAKIETLETKVAALEGA
jgi:hypothetical protein